MSLSFLPPHLAERSRWIRPLPATGQTEPTTVGCDFVLYWMHHAVRGHENPSLDVAICYARKLGLPLLVYHALCEQYPYASDRHHTFILQGARDVQRELADRGISYVFHLQRCGSRGAHLRDLVRRAAILISDEMPVEPITGWTQRLVTMCETPILSVDSSCVVPVPLVKRAYTRAFEYRDATRRLYAQRVTAEYHDQPTDCAMFTGELPFEPLDLQRADLAQLTAACQIDHSVAPVADTPGGTRAGYARWEAFKKKGLRSYARRRNDAADHGGVSRLSAYFHFGMISPLRIAREAAEYAAEKFLDELLIWRELAFHFCFHMGEKVDTLDGIPDWARETLLQHAADRRTDHHSWETLARGVTGDPLWDDCQQSLLKHGELHNNVRMTWGKAFLKWTQSPERALQMAIDLNHRYALDGRDPNSYGGLLWCFGQFDRPFEPEQPVLGSVRPRELEEHAQRINLEKYRSVVHRPIVARPPTVAIVGAGIAGLIAARTLADHGLQVRLFDKSRGVGGRLATRRTTEGLRFDHGAQYFTARDNRFLRYVRSWVDDGVVAPFSGRIVHLRDGEVLGEKSDTPRYVARPTMNVLAKHLADQLDVRFETTVSQLQRVGTGRWRLIDAQQQSLGEFDRVICNCPPPQSGPLLAGHSDLSQRIQTVKMNPCWAVMIHRSERSESLDFDGAFVDSSPLSWICRDSAKPGRQVDSGECWVLHASAAWSIEHLEAAPDDVSAALIEAFAKATGEAVGKLHYVAAHRWRYAIPVDVLEESCLWDSTEGLGACGDWCGGPRVEGAFLSGMAVAGHLLREVTIDRPAFRAGEELFAEL